MASESPRSNGERWRKLFSSSVDEAVRDTIENDGFMVDITIVNGDYFMVYNSNNYGFMVPSGKHTANYGKSPMLT